MTSRSDVLKNLPRLELFDSTCATLAFFGSLSMRKLLDAVLLVVATFVAFASRTTFIVVDHDLALFPFPHQLLGHNIDDPKAHPSNYRSLSILQAARCGKDSGTKSETQLSSWRPYYPSCRVDSSEHCCRSSG